MPAFGSLAADPIYSLFDTAFVGHLGTEELAAVAIGSAAFTASFWFFSFLAYGVTPAVARAVGANDREAAGKMAGQAILLAVVLGVVVTLIGTVWAEPIVRALGGEGEVAALAEPYLQIRALASIPVLLITVGHGWLRGAQDTRTPMAIVVIAAVVNVALDYLFIYVFEWGVEGAAWSTVIGQTGAALAFVVVLGRRATSLRLRIDRPVMRSLLRVGADLVVRSGAIVGALTATTAIAARMGTVRLASWTITMQMFAFLALSLDSVAIAAQALVGRNLGASDPAGARAIAGRLMTWGAALGVALLGLVWLGRVPLAKLFSSDEEVIAATIALFGWLALVQPLAAAAFTLDGILIGAADTRVLAAGTVAASVVFVGGGLVALDMDWGTAGLAGATTAWLAGRSIVFGVRLRRGRWAS